MSKKLELDIDAADAVAMCSLRHIIKISMAQLQDPLYHPSNPNNVIDHIDALTTIDACVKILEYMGEKVDLNGYEYISPRL